MPWAIPHQFFNDKINICVVGVVWVPDCCGNHALWWSQRRWFPNLACGNRLCLVLKKASQSSSSFEHPWLEIVFYTALFLLRKQHIWCFCFEPEAISKVLDPIIFKKGRFLVWKRIWAPLMVFVLLWAIWKHCLRPCLIWCWRQSRSDLVIIKLRILPTNSHIKALGFIRTELFPRSETKRVLNETAVQIGIVGILLFVIISLGERVP